MSIQVKSSARLENNAFIIKIRSKPSENFVFVFVEWKNNEEPIYYIVPRKYVYEDWKPNYINKSDIINNKDRWSVKNDFFLFLILLLLFFNTNTVIVMIIIIKNTITPEI
jgi:hypothetical protein